MLIAASEEQINSAHGNGGYARWGHDFKITDPYGKERFEDELKRYTPNKEKNGLKLIHPRISI